MGQDINIISLKRIFEKQYIIPLFQREYSWDKDQIKTLKNDIKNERKRYCLGIITVKNNKLIDGQQRLTTLYLIAIWCGLLKQKEEIKLCYELDSILGRKNRLTKFLYDKSKENDLSSLVNGWEIIKKLISEEEKNVFKEKMENNLFFYEIVLDNNVDLNHYFEVMNSRGLQLSRIDIVKSLLMQILTNEEDRTRLNYLWYTYENMDQTYPYFCTYASNVGEYITKKQYEKLCELGFGEDPHVNLWCRWDT